MQSARTSFLPRLCLWLIVAFLSSAAVLCGTDARAQGFMVKPMTMTISAVPGRTSEVPLEIRNTAGGAAGTIDVRLVDLSQRPDGSWDVIEPKSGADVSHISSSLAWTSLSESSVKIAPLQPAQVTVRVTPPPAARGAYFAAILAETPLPKDNGGIRVRVRFLIPLIIEIEGRPVRQQVKLNGVHMDFHDGKDGHAVTTTATVQVANAGRTFSRIKGRMVVERSTDGRWRPVTRYDLKEHSIIPGVTLDLTRDLKRRLPSGTYRLHADLEVDGRRIAPLEKKIDFKGDPKASALAYDTALILTPDKVAMKVVPGATRTTTLRIENPGKDPVKVEMNVTTPPQLVGVALGDLHGVQMSAAPWTRIIPSHFTIRPGVRQNVRVISSVPRKGAEFPNYYADLTLEGTYADGQSAGETRSVVHLSNSSAKTVRKGVVEDIRLAEADKAGEYLVRARFANIGNVDVEPTAHLYVLTPQGRQVRNVVLTGDEGMLLPLSKRTFGGKIDSTG